MSPACWRWCGDWRWRSGAAYVHLRWLPRHGINGWTDEPGDKYFAPVTQRRKSQ